MSVALNSKKFATKGHKRRDRVKMRYGGGYSLPLQKLFSSHKSLPMWLRKYKFLSYYRLDYRKII